MRPATMTAVTVLTLAAAGAARAQDARANLLRGNYAEAVEQYRALPDDRAAERAVGVAQCQTAQGRYDEALKSLAAAGEPTAEIMTQRAIALRERGDLADALAAVEQSLRLRPDDPQSRWVRLELWEAGGRHDDAVAESAWFVRHYNDARPTAAEELYFVARGAAAYAQWNQAPDQFDFILNTLLPDALAADERYWPVLWYSGQLLVEKYNLTEGVPDLKKAATLNPQATPVLVSLGQAAYGRYAYQEARQFADQALAVNPKEVDALLLRADVEIADHRTADARDFLDRAIAVRPHDEQVLGRRAAFLSLTQRPEEADKLEQDVLSRNAAPGVFHEAAAAVLDRRRKFLRAETAYRKAVAAAPWRTDALNGLGMTLMALGEETEAKEVFAKARTLDPYHVRVANMSKVLDHLAEYRTIESDHYLVMVHPEADAVLGRYMSDYLERQHPVLVERFGYEPPEKTRIEIMKDHKWFSGRAVGLPSVGTVGACTGKVVALASPTALKNSFNWARVLTHEVTHIITLQQTGFDIPHWYTEALAVLSEESARPQQWNRLLRERVPARKLFDLSNLNYAFIHPDTPDDWQFAYCQSMLYARYMMQRFGEGSLARLLDRYGRGDETPAAIETAFAVPLADFEAGYRDYLDELVAGLSESEEQPLPSFAEAEKAYRKDPRDAAVCGALAYHHYRRENLGKARQYADEAKAVEPHQPLAAYVLSRMEYGIGNVERALVLIDEVRETHPLDERLLQLRAAIDFRRGDYEAAESLFATVRDRDPLNQKWVEALAKIYLKTGRTDRLRTTLADLARLDVDDLPVRQKLAALAADAEDWDEAAEWADQCLHIDVKDAAAHRILALAATETKDWPTAVRELVYLVENDDGENWQDRLAEAKRQAASGEADLNLPPSPRHQGDDCR